VFSPDDRDRVKSALLAGAEHDDRIAAAALLGSSATASEDGWSDIDLALELAADGGLAVVLRDWTEKMYERHTAVHHLDVHWRDAVYRVFLLSESLQVDISFWPPGQLRPAGPRFRLLFGEVGEARPAGRPRPEHLIGMGWLYLLHGRSSIERGRLWQAEYMIGVARSNVLALACLRLDLPTRDARGVDDLPTELLAAAMRGWIGSPEVSRLRRALAATTELLLGETEHVNPELAARLGTTLRPIAAPS
jgi:predicted nucleotidyltransferase